MDQLPDITQLRHAADYRAYRKLFRYSAAYGIVFGACCILVGAMAINANPPVAMFCLYLGAILAVTAIWMLVSPNSNMLIVLGAALFLLGSALILSAILSVFVSISRGTGNPPVALVFYGAIIASFGGRLISGYKRFAKFTPAKPEKESADFIEKTVKDIKKTKAKNTENILEFQKKSFANSGKWKAALLEGAAVLTQTSGQDMIVENKADVEFTKTRELKKGKQIEATLRAGGRTLKTVIGAVSYSNYEKWKSSEAASGAQIPQPESP